jgi:hypothetical protein
MKDKFFRIIHNTFSDNKNLSTYYLCDKVYSEYITGISLFTDSARKIAAQRIVDCCDEKGIFHDVDDSKGHNVYHSISYHLSALKCLKHRGLPIEGEISSSFIVNSLKDKMGLSPTLTFYEKTNFWRGSHKVGGLISSAILYNELFESELILSLPEYTNDWCSHWADTVNNNGLWSTSNFLISFAFDIMYKIKHDPNLAKYGAAAHLYWVFTYLERSDLLLNKINKNEVIENILKIYSNNFILEKTPYCLDYDVIYILDFVSKGSNSPEIDHVFENVGMAIFTYICNDTGVMWPHAFPGALATLAICQNRSKKFDEYLIANKLSFSIPVKMTPWL